jgi:N utilization substance protein A
MPKKKVKEEENFMVILHNVAKEKNIDEDIIIEAMEQALASAYKRSEGQTKATVDRDTGSITLVSVRNVVEEVQDNQSEISLEDAQKIVPDIQIGETIERPITIKDPSRVIARTAVQVVGQRIKEAEKNSISEEFKDKQDELLVGTLSREDAKTYYVDLGRTFGLLPKAEIIPGEKLEMGSQIKAYVSKLEIGTKGPFILLSRTHYGFLKRLLEKEIPEINDGTILLYSVARDAGSRSKIAVYTYYDNIEPIGSVIGQGGSRIGRILKQLNGEKIDVVEYDKDPVTFIANALSPAKDIKVIITNEKNKEALALVNKDNLSLAIGKKGQNVKLASRLTHYKIEVKDIDEVDLDEIKVQSDLNEE